MLCAVKSWCFKLFKKLNFLLLFAKSWSSNQIAHNKIVTLSLQRFDMKSFVVLSISRGSKESFSILFLKKKSSGRVKPFNLVQFKPWISFSVVQLMPHISFLNVSLSLLCFLSSICYFFIYIMYCGPPLFCYILALLMDYHRISYNLCVRQHGQQIHCHYTF